MHISGISQVYLGYISGLSQIYLSYISGISPVYLVSCVYLRYISSQVYLWQFSSIFKSISKAEVNKVHGSMEEIGEELDICI